MYEELIVMDMYFDILVLLVQFGFDIMYEYIYDSDFFQVDVLCMNEGGLDGGFWVIYIL